MRLWLHWIPDTGHQQAVKSYYTDRHEELTNVEYRVAYCARQERLELRMPVWVQLTEAQHAALKKKQPDLPDGKPYELREGNRMVHFGMEINSRDSMLRSQQHPQIA